jgi:5-methylcytosine-specific restriction endonuclease McrA
MATNYAVPKALREAVLKRDNYLCVYDGAPATEADHITPRKLGGPDELWNLVAACKSCNSSKGARTNARLTWFDRDWLDYA